MRTRAVSPRRVASGQPDPGRYSPVPDPHGSEPFDERRPGLDHLAFACANRAELEQWESKLNALGIENGGIVDAPYGSGLSFRDPDNIALEFLRSPWVRECAEPLQPVSSWLRPDGCPSYPAEGDTLNPKVDRAFLGTQRTADPLG